MIYFEKSIPGALSEVLGEALLKDNANVYRDGPVYERLKADFFEKCYLCEDDEITSIQIEHFEPHQGILAKKYDWGNLFYSCGHCNNIKGAQFWPLLNCTDASHNIWESLEMRFIPFPKARLEIVLTGACLHAAEGKNTLDLLDKIYSGKNATAMKTDEARTLRKKILRAHDRLVFAIGSDDFDSVWKYIVAGAPFSGIMRWTLKNEYPKLFSVLMT